MLLLTEYMLHDQWEDDIILEGNKLMQVDNFKQCFSIEYYGNLVVIKVSCLHQKTLKIQKCNIAKILKFVIVIIWNLTTFVLFKRLFYLITIYIIIAITKDF